MAIKYVAIDSGKFATKAVTLKPGRTEKLLVFRTKMEETNRASAQGTSSLVEYEGKKYILGEQAEVGSSKSSKAELLHKVAVYTAYKREHVRKIIRQLQENRWNLRTMELVFVGGASELLRKEITERFPAAKLYEDAALLNVRGFLKALTE